MEQALIRAKAIYNQVRGKKLTIEEAASLEGLPEASTLTLIGSGWYIPSTAVELN